MTRLPSFPALFGLTLGLVLAAGAAGETPFNPADVQCYRVAGSQSPAPIGRSATHTAQDTLAQRERAVSTTLQQTSATLARCTSTSCGAADAGAFTRNLAAYLRQRQEFTTAFYRERGVQGLELAAQLYGDPRVEAIRRHAAALIAQRTLRVADLASEREALALALFKPASHFRPCAAIQRPVYRGYVY